MPKDAKKSALKSIFDKKFVGFMLFSFALFTVAAILPVFQKKYSQPDEAPSGNSVKNSPLSSTALSLLEQKSAFNEKIFLENPDMPPPTNQWISSIVFRSHGEPLFAYPLAVKMNDRGFGISFPDIVSTENTVFGSYAEELEVAIGEGLETSLSAYDDLSAEIAGKSAGEERYSLRLTRGSPFIFTQVKNGEEAVVSSKSLRITKRGDDFFVFEGGEKSFAVFFEREAMTVSSSGEDRLAIRSLRDKAFLTFAVLPKGIGAETFLPYAFNPIVKTSVDATREQGKFLTTFNIATRTGQPILLALLPHQRETFRGDAQDFGGYRTLRGEQRLFQGNRFTFEVPATVPPERLDIASLGENEKSILRETLREDAKLVSFPETDSYFAGKKLYAVSNLLDMAKQLGMEAEGAMLQEALKAELSAWKQNSFRRGHEGKYFYYDPKLRGMVGMKASFGSELFNDHNFHYGYFIYAASVLARYDAEYLRENKEFIHLLVKDIMNKDRKDTAFAYLRPFDFYEGHSWASGLGLFADGNNQESSSEAVNAWYAVFLWARISENKTLENTALWLYNQEAESALRYWLNFDQDDPRFQNFRHSNISLLWGGKMDWATWFSPLPEAILGIQLIPINAGSGYLGRDPARVLNNLSQSKVDSASIFRDFLIMYESFGDTASARRNMERLTRSEVDTVNSLSYIKAWLFVMEQKNASLPSINLP